MTTQLVRLLPDFRVAKFREATHTSEGEIVIEEEVRFDNRIATNAHGDHLVEASLKGFALEFLDSRDVSWEAVLGREEVRVDVISVDGRRVKVQLVARLRPMTAGPGFHFRASGQALVSALTEADQA
ncbi:hypothetical protein [Streptomyces sp. NPDC020362]|uniref:hypothetical protein n=1 Tax=unclassified Streptomyces TaxID=2593676 RepID=UPI0033ECF8A8